PHQLAVGEGAVLAGTAPTDDELLEAQLAAFERRIERTEGERARLVDAYQAAIIDLAELSRRSTELTQRRPELVAEQHALPQQRSPEDPRPREPLPAPGPPSDNSLRPVGAPQGQELPAPRTRARRRARRPGSVAPRLRLTGGSPTTPLDANQSPSAAAHSKT